jgi:hypothetical protein
MFKWSMRLLSTAVVVLVLWWAVRPKRAGTPGIPAAPTQPASQDLSCGNKLIDGESVGELRIGMSIDSLGEYCHVKRDTVQPGPEGTTERRVTVAFPPALVDAEIVEGRVWRIDIKSPAFRTADSLGVGSSVRDVLRRDEADGAAGEGAFYLISLKHCGLSYRLSGGIPTGAIRRWDSTALSGLPASTEVTQVLVTGCPSFRRREPAKAR